MALIRDGEAADEESVLTRMAREGEVKVIAESNGDKFDLTPKGERMVEDLMARLVSKYDNTKEWDSIMGDLAKVMEEHGILAAVGQRAALLRRGQFSFELRFRFVGGNKKLCNIH